MTSRSEHSGGKAAIAIPRVKRDLKRREVLLSFGAAIAAFTITRMTPSGAANRHAQKRALRPVPAPAQPAARFSQDYLWLSSLASSQ